MALDTAVLTAGVVGEAAVCAFILKRKVWRVLPFFAAYLFWTLISDVASSVILWKMSAQSTVYGRYYIGQTVIDSLMQFAVLVELAWSVLKPVRSSMPRGAIAALSALVALAGLLIWPLAGLALPQTLTGLSAILFHLQETFAILRVACFLIMASFSQLLSIGWRDRELQIATGLGFYSICSLLVTMLHSHQALGSVGQMNQYHWLDVALSVSYLGTLAYWVLSFAAKEQERKEFSPQMQQLLVLMGGGARAGRIALSDLPSERLRKKD